MSQTRLLSSSPDKNTILAQTYDALSAVEHDIAAGAIGLTAGVVVIDGAGALALTLADPTSGSQDAATPGNDGQELTIVGKTAHAHTVTTPANGINGNKHILTFANVGDSATLVAYGGVWYLLNTTATLS